MNEMTWKRFETWVRVGVLLAALAALLMFAGAGSFSRLWADDYCYSATVQEHGALRGVWEWYSLSGNRFSVIPLVALTDELGLWGVRLLPGLVLLVWVLAGWSLLGSLSPGSRRIELLAGALLLTLFVVWMAPHRLQTVYWRMGILHYSLPAPLAMFLAAWAVRWLRFSRALRLQWPGLLGMAFLAFFTAGLSETFAAMQEGALLMLIAWAWFALPGQRSRLLALGAAIGVSTLLAMGLMALSPSNAWRQAALPPPDSLWQLIYYTLRYTAAFLYHSAWDLPLPNLVWAAFVGLWAWSLGGEGVRLGRRAWLWLTGIGLFALGLIVCATAPSVYGGLVAPAGRALMPARFAWLLGVGGAAFILGRWAAGRWMPTSAPRLRLALLLGLLLLSLYPLRMVPVAQQEAEELAVKAQRWDARHAQLLADRAAGQRDLLTIETDVVQSLEDYGPNPQDWVNHCAAAYYQVQSLTAK